jgi:hypothetical protein
MAMKGVVEVAVSLVLGVAGLAVAYMLWSTSR